MPALQLPLIEKKEDILIVVDQFRLTKTGLILNYAAVNMLYVD